jgi:hypothetical protein
MASALANIVGSALAGYLSGGRKRKSYSKSSKARAVGRLVGAVHI